MAMRTRIRAHWAKVRFLFTAVVALAILFTLMYLLAGGGLLNAKVDLYSYFEDSGGMENGILVMYNGVKIGKVKSVKLSHRNDPQRAVVVRMSVDRRFLSQIPDDSKSEIVVENFLGDKIIQINRGQSSTPVKENAELAHKPATNVYIRIDLTTFAAQLRVIDAQLRDIQDGKGPLGQFVMTDQLYKDLISGVKEIEKQITAMADTKSNLGGLLYGTEMYDKASGALQRLDKTLAEIQAGRGAAGKLATNPAQYDDLRKTADNLRRQMASLRDSDFMKSDAQYVTWNKNVAGMSRSVDAFNASPMLSSVQVYEGLLGSTQAMESTLKDFRSNPKKYLRLKIF